MTIPQSSLLLPNREYTYPLSPMFEVTYLCRANFSIRILKQSGSLVAAGVRDDI